MKQLTYRKYYYGGEYGIETMNLPDDVIIYSVNMENIGYRIDNADDDNYTKGYLFVSKNDFKDLVDEDVIKLNDHTYVLFKEAMLIEDPSVTILDISKAKPIEDSYIIYRSKCETPFHILDVLMDESATAEEIAEAQQKLEEYYAESSKIEIIEKITRLDANGLELVVVDMANDYIQRQVVKWAYFYFLDQREAKISNDTEHKQMFIDRVNQITLNVLNY